MPGSSGQIRILDALLATTLIFSALAFASLLHTPVTLSKQEGLGGLGRNALIELDENGTLGFLIDSGNWTSIRESLKILLPTGVSFNLTVFDEAEQPINNSTISNGGLLDRRVISVQYLCASQGPDSNLYLLRLQLAWAW